MLLTLGGLMLVCSIICFLLPAKKINSLYGYRTKLAMKNQDIWDAGQKHAAIALGMLSVFYILVGLIVEYVSTISEGAQTMIFISGVIVMLIEDDMYLKKRFHSDGTRKM